MEKNGANGLLSEHYLHYLLREAVKSDRQVKRLVRRLDNLEKQCSENTTDQPNNDEYKMKKRMYSVGISYYATRAEYCYHKAKMEFKKQEE